MADPTSFVGYIRAADEELMVAYQILNTTTSTDDGLRDKKWLAEYHTARALAFATLAVAMKPQPDFGVM